MSACPYCGSTASHWKPKAEQYECEACAKSFDGPAPDAATNFRPQHIFLSYGHDDNAVVVEELHHRLEAAGHTVWIDKSKIKGGADWRATITEGIRKSDRVLSFLSKHSTRDPGVCLDEIGIALVHRHGAIATLLVEPVAEVSPPPTVSHIQYLDFSNWREEREKGQEAWQTRLDSWAATVLGIIAENVGFAGEMDELLRLLKPWPQSRRAGNLVSGVFVGRQWLFDAIESWRKDKQGTRTWFLVSGPGMGKSTMVAHLAHFHPRTTIAYFFCRHNEPETRSGHTFIRTLAFQLAARMPAYLRLVLDAARRSAKPLEQIHPDDLFTLLLSDPLHNIIDGGLRDDRMLVVIDALDEAPEIATLLARRQGELPAWLALVLTSRPDAGVMSSFAGTSRRVLHPDDPRNREDLEALLDGWFARMDCPPPAAARAVLLERSEGNMLYLATISDGVRKEIFDLSRPDDFPRGLGGIYKDWFTRQFGESPGRSRDWPGTYGLLELVCASPEPLPLSLARRCLGWKGQDQINAIHPLGSLIRTTGDLLELFHRSLADWLKDADMAGCFWVNAEDGRINLAKVLWAMVPEFEVNGESGYLHRRLPGLLASIPLDRRAEVWGNDESRVARMTKLDELLYPVPDINVITARLDLAQMRLDESLKLFGDDDNKTIDAMFCLASLLDHVAKDHERARNLQERVLDARRRRLGDEHPETLSAMTYLAISLYSSDQTGAVKLLERVFDACRRIHGDEHSDTFAAMTHLRLMRAALRGRPGRS